MSKTEENSELTSRSMEEEEEVVISNETAIEENEDITSTTKDTKRMRCILRIRPRLNKSEVDLPQHVNVSPKNPRKVVVAPHGRRHPVNERDNHHLLVIDLHRVTTDPHRVIIDPHVDNNIDPHTVSDNRHHPHDFPRSSRRTRHLLQRQHHRILQDLAL